MKSRSHQTGSINFGPQRIYPFRSELAAAVGQLGAQPGEFEQSRPRRGPAAFVIEAGLKGKARRRIRREPRQEALDNRRRHDRIVLAGKMHLREPFDRVGAYGWIERT